MIKQAAAFSSPVSPFLARNAWGLDDQDKTACIFPQKPEQLLLFAKRALDVYVSFQRSARCDLIIITGLARE